MIENGPSSFERDALITTILLLKAVMISPLSGSLVPNTRL
jgi:hypothetical protein